MLDTRGLFALWYTHAMKLWKWEVRLGPNDQSGLGAYLGDLSTYLNDGSTPANVNQTAAVEFALGMISRAFMLADAIPGNTRAHAPGQEHDGPPASRPGQRRVRDWP